MTGLSLPLTRRPGRARDNIIPGFAVFGPKSIPLEMEVRYGSYSVDSVDGWREVRRSQITHHRATEQGPQLQILTAPVSRSAGARGYPALLPSASKSLCRVRNEVAPLEERSLNDLEITSSDFDPVASAGPPGGEVDRVCATVGAVS
jgi:hypothetical protein